MLTFTYTDDSRIASISGTLNGPLGYAGGFGYQQDATGYKLLGHRYYDPDAGRFLTRDPAKDGANWWNYCYNKPTYYADIDGLEPVSLTLVIIGVVVVAGIVITVWGVKDKGEQAETETNAKRESLGRAIDAASHIVGEEDNCIIDAVRRDQDRVQRGLQGASSTTANDSVSVTIGGVVGKGAGFIGRGVATANGSPNPGLVGTLTEESTKTLIDASQHVNTERKLK